MRKGHFKNIVLLVMLFAGSACGISKSIHHQPAISSYDQTIPRVDSRNGNNLHIGQNSLLQNKQKLWELYVSGDPLQRGLITGSLTDSLLRRQEHIFFSKITDMIPSASRLKIIRQFLKWYNRKLYKNVTDEYQAEIYGLSQHSTHDYDNIASPFLRSLYLHGAHDIGHALQDLALVGCSSFAVAGDKSEDGTLILGRNFDFYVGDAFAENKVVAFVNPENGIPFMMVTWPGMIGAVSGMNNEGLTVTINAGKSKIPLIAKTPISILTREILQYAKNIDEAIAIAKKRKVFVAESIMVGSAHDKKAVLIEVSPHNLGVYEMPENHQLISTNHFQSDAYKNDKRNKKHIINSHSQYRYERLAELLAQNGKLNPEKAAAILRNKDGLNEKALGFGNEKALNQLIAHHAVIFKPERRLVWVSSNPYQLGEFVCYDLTKIFNSSNDKPAYISFADTTKNIPQDSFLYTKAYLDYEQFKIADRTMDAALDEKTILPDNFIPEYVSLNPEYWQVYYKAGKMAMRNKQYGSAKQYFEKALSKEITTIPEKAKVEKQLKKVNKKLR
ncbi:MAG: C45 family peptidase [Chitinophagaceae bacterium]